MKKAEVKPDEELANAAQTLDQITDEWIEQQKSRFENITTFRKRQISDCFSDFYILKFFKDKIYKKRFDDVLNTFHLYIPNIAESLKERWNNFVSSVRFMQKGERDRDKAEKNHGLGFWLINFFNTATARTVNERLKNQIVESEKARKELVEQLDELKDTAEEIQCETTECDQEQEILRASTDNSKESGKPITFLNDERLKAAAELAKRLR
jgi:hypothetical protein